MFTDSNPYFSVPHSFNAYLSPWPDSSPLPSEFELKSMQSVGLQLLSEVKTLEDSCLLQLRHLNNDAKAVMEYLKLQSRKVDLVLQYMLENEVQEGTKHQGIKFGGSGIDIQSATPLALGSIHKVTIYVRDELIAILCFASVSQCQAHPETPEQWHIGLTFNQILDTDVESLVKASLSVQQKLLKHRKQAKEQAE